MSRYISIGLQDHSIQGPLYQGQVNAHALPRLDAFSQTISGCLWRTGFMASTMLERNLNWSSFECDQPNCDKNISNNIPQQISQMSTTTLASTHLLLHDPSMTIEINCTHFVIQLACSKVKSTDNTFLNKHIRKSIAYDLMISCSAKSQHSLLPLLFSLQEFSLDTEKLQNYLWFKSINTQIEIPRFFRGSDSRYKIAMKLSA